jgi:hypothetical protein
MTKPSEESVASVFIIEELAGKYKWLAREKGLAGLP